MLQTWHYLIIDCYIPFIRRSLRLFTSYTEISHPGDRCLFASWISENSFMVHISNFSTTIEPTILMKTVHSFFSMYSYWSESHVSNVPCHSDGVFECPLYQFKNCPLFSQLSQNWLRNVASCITKLRLTRKADSSTRKTNSKMNHIAPPSNLKSTLSSINVQVPSAIKILFYCAPEPFLCHELLMQDFGPPEAVS